MTIAEMHVWFRQYAQQMGMQNVRAILPEQIDNLINTSIKDTIDEVVNRNVGTTNDRVITDNSKLANINALRTLYKVKTIKFNTTDTPSSIKNKTVSQFVQEAFTFNSANIGNALYFVDFAIRYWNGTDETAVNLKKTRWFPIRIIDDSYLADVLNDWVLAPRMRTPVMVVYKDQVAEEDSLDAAVSNTLTAYNNAVTTYNEVMADPESTAEEKTAASVAMTSALTAYKTAVSNRNNYRSANIETSTFEIYFGENDSIQSIASNYYIEEVRCSYIKKPNEVRYLSDIGGDNIDSDLPEQLQIPMLKHAVDLYRISIQGSLYANQQNAQQNQQELARNNARPDNDGYQS